MPFPHSQNIVNANFFFPALNQKAVRVKQKNHRENYDNPAGIVQNQLYIFLFYTSILRKRIHNVIHHNRKDCCKNIGNISLPIIFHVRGSKSYINRAIQVPHLLRSGR